MRVVLVVVALLLFSASSALAQSAWGGQQNREGIIKMSARVLVTGGESELHRSGQATHLGDGLWITVADLLEGGFSDVTVAGHDAEVVYVSPIEDEQDNWLILRTADFVPVHKAPHLGGCMPCKGDSAFYFTDLNCWDSLFRVGFIDQDETTWSVVGGFCFFLAREADDSVQGAGVFNTCGNLVGLMTSYPWVLMDVEGGPSPEGTWQIRRKIQATLVVTPDWDKVREAIDEIHANERYWSFLDW